MMKNTNNEMENKSKERIQLFKYAARLKKTYRTLNIANFFAWIVYDAGQKLNTVYRDYQMRTDVLIRFQEKYEFDLYIDNLTRNPALISDALGSSSYIINDEKFSINMKDFSFMDADDYDELIKIYADGKGAGFAKFLWKRIVPKKFEKLAEPGAREKLRKAALAAQDYFNYIDGIPKILLEKCGVPSFSDNFTLETYYESLINSYRGMKQTAIDLLRIPEKVKALCGAVGLGPDFEKYKATTKKGSNINTCADIATPMLGHTFLSSRHFRELYWPGFEKLFQFIEEKDKILFIFAEGETFRFYDFLKEAPRGHVVLQVEKDDVFETKKVLGDKICIAGGMPCHLLHNGTVKENIAYAKRLIDEMGPGYIFSTNKMMSFPADCKAENLKAVNEFVRDYRP